MSTVKSSVTKLHLNPRSAFFGLLIVALLGVSAWTVSNTQVTADTTSPTISVNDLETIRSSTQQIANNARSVYDVKDHDIIVDLTNDSSTLIDKIKSTLVPYINKFSLAKVKASNNVAILAVNGAYNAYYSTYNVYEKSLIIENSIVADNKMKGDLQTAKTNAYNQSQLTQTTAVNLNTEIVRLRNLPATAAKAVCKPAAKTTPGGMVGAPSTPPATGTKPAGSATAKPTATKTTPGATVKPPTAGATPTPSASTSASNTIYTVQTDSNGDKYITYNGVKIPAAGGGNDPTYFEVGGKKYYLNSSSDGKSTVTVPPGADNVVAALPTVNSGALTSPISLENPTKFTTLGQLVTDIPTILLSFIGIAALFGFLFGAYLYFLSGGAEEQLTKGKTQMVGSLIALFIVLSAVGIMYEVNKFVGSGTTSGGTTTTSDTCPTTSSTSSSSTNTGTLDQYGLNEAQQAKLKLINEYPTGTVQASTDSNGTVTLVFPNNRWPDAASLEISSDSGYVSTRYTGYSDGSRPAVDNTTSTNIPDIYGLNDAQQAKLKLIHEYPSTATTGRVQTSTDSNGTVTLVYPDNTRPAAASVEISSNSGGVTIRFTGYSDGSR